MGLRLGYPPLSCRTSPPQGGRSRRSRDALISTYRDGKPERCEMGSRCGISISLLVGEMSGRTEGGIPNNTPELLPKRRSR